MAFPTERLSKDLFLKPISVWMISAAAAILSGSVTANAAPQTFVCVMLASGGDIDPRMKNVDRIVVDPDEPRLDFQVSETMNSATQENWAYYNAQSEFFGKSSVTIHSTNTLVMAAGFSSTHTMNFIINGREAGFTQLNDKLATGFIKWRCGKF
jgi:hypothetical protein